MKKQLLKIAAIATVIMIGSFQATKAQTNTFPATGSVGVGTLAPNASAIMDLTSTTQGALLPRMTSAQKSAIVTPATGLLIYQTDGTKGIYMYSGTGWYPVTTSVATLATKALNNLAAVAINTSLTPATTGTIDLGSATKTWRDLYATGNVNTGAVNVNTGNVNMNSAASTIQFALPTTTSNGMMTMFPSGTLNSDRMVLQHSPSFPTWGLQYQDTADKFNFLSGGTPVLTADLGNQRVGVMTSTPGARVDIAGTGTYVLNGGGYSDFRLGDANYHLKMGVANAGGGAGDAYVAASSRLYLGTSNTFARSQTIAINPEGTVGIGSYVANAKLGVTSDSTIPVISATATYAGGNANVRGVQSTAVIAPGYGYGVYATGGYMGGYFNNNATTYAGTGYGVYGVSTGTAGSRYGVVGVASGTGGVRYGVYGSANSGTENWGGYFPTKTYTSELRVGGTQGATGYVAAINGKLIATEVRVEALASWPDYVFSSNHKLLSLEELEASINANKHLPGVPSAAEVKEGGIMLGAMQTKTMEKVEENTLYIIELNKKIKLLEDKIEQLTKAVK